MADVKWIKIVTDIFDDEKMYAIETLPDGITIEVVWFKLLCLAGKCNSSGFLSINNKLAYTDEMLAKVFRIDIGVVQRALDVFQKLEMVELVDNAYMISNWAKYQNNDRLEQIKEKNRERQKRFRDKQKLEIEDTSNAKTVTNNVTSNVTNNVNCSYSISYSFNSNNTNLLNLNNLLKGDYKESIYILNNKELLESIKEWMEYKDEKKPKKDHHYTERGMKGTLTEIVNYDKDYGTKAVTEQIRHAIAKEWRGTNLEMLKDTAKKLPKQKTPEPKEPEQVMTDDEWVRMMEATYGKDE